MNILKRKVEITYEWRAENGQPISTQHAQELDDQALEQIYEALWENNSQTSGMLYHNVYKNEGTDDVEYKGEWYAAYVPIT